MAIWFDDCTAAERPAEQPEQASGLPATRRKEKLEQMQIVQRHWPLVLNRIA